jgi:hypothetical protein
MTDDMNPRHCMMSMTRSMTISMMVWMMWEESQGQLVGWTRDFMISTSLTRCFQSKTAIVAAGVGVVVVRMSRKCGKITILYLD